MSATPMTASGPWNPMDFAARPRWPLDQKAERIHNGKA
jgi:hypothetical protein